MKPESESNHFLPEAAAFLSLFATPLLVLMAAMSKTRSDVQYSLVLGIAAGYAVLVLVSVVGVVAKRLWAVRSMALLYAAAALLCAAFALACIEFDLWLGGFWALVALFDGAFAAGLWRWHPLNKN